MAVSDGEAITDFSGPNPDFIHSKRDLGLGFSRRTPQSHYIDEKRSLKLWKATI